MKPRTLASMVSSTPNPSYLLQRDFFLVFLQIQMTSTHIGSSENLATTLFWTGETQLSDISTALFNRLSSIIRASNEFITDLTAEVKKDAVLTLWVDRVCGRLSWP